MCFFGFVCSLVVYEKMKKWDTKKSVRDLRHLKTPIVLNRCIEPTPLSIETLVLGEIYFIAGELQERANGTKRVVATIDLDEYGAFMYLGNFPQMIENILTNNHFFMHLAYRGEKNPQLETYFDDQLEQLRFCMLL